MTEQIDSNSYGENDKKMSKQELIDHLGFVMQQCHMKGNNDSEIDTLKNIQEEVIADKVRPIDFKAIAARAAQILDDKIER